MSYVIRYVLLPQRMVFELSGLQTGLDFAHCGLKFQGNHECI